MRNRPEIQQDQIVEVLDSDDETNMAEPAPPAASTGLAPEPSAVAEDTLPTQLYAAPGQPLMDPAYTNVPAVRTFTRNEERSVSKAASKILRYETTGHTLTLVELRDKIHFLLSTSELHALMAANHRMRLATIRGPAGADVITVFCQPKDEQRLRRRRH
jgi:hypothetical protein